MQSQIYPNNLNIKNQGFLPGFKLVNFLMTFCGCMVISLVLIACNPVPETNIEPVITTASGFEEEATATIPTIGIQETPMPSQTSTPVITPLPTIQPTLTPTLQIVSTSTPQTEVQGITGQLFVHDSLGIQQVNLPDNVQEYVLIKENNWINWGSRFAQNQKYLTYWVESANGTELWFTPLAQWQPERILEIDGVEYDFATPLWGVNDRYLLFNLSILDNSSLLEEIRTIRTYIFDTQTMEFVNSPYWSGDCSILAPSPQTGQIALWCAQTQLATNSQEFLVLEPDESPWFTPDPPATFIDNCLITAVCGWSKDGEFVAYVTQEHAAESLFYTAVNNVIPIRLDDKQTTTPAFLSWSPNNQLLYYSGACGDGTSQCPNVMSVVDQAVVWRAINNYNGGELGLISVDHVTWSPDSLYMAMPVLSAADIGEQILILDVWAQKEVLRVPATGNKILDLVWVAN